MKTQDPNNTNPVSLSDIFQMFVSPDDHLNALHAPFELNGRVYATDRHILIRTDKANIDFAIENPHIPPNCEAVIPPPNTSEIINVPKEPFEQLKTEEEYKLVGEKIVCRECEGEGEVEWEYKYYTKEDDCPECNGSGFEREKTKVKTGGKTYGNDSIVKIKDGYFDPKYVEKLPMLKDFTGSEIELISYNHPHKPIVFKIGKFEVLIMPKIGGEYANVLNLNHQ